MTGSQLPNHYGPYWITGFLDFYLLAVHNLFDFEMFLPWLMTHQLLGDFLALRSLVLTP
jgi:hypothetical protein